MNFINKLERKFGRFAIQNLTTIIIGCYIIGYALTFASSANFNILSYLTLEPAMILRGQVWRLLTWVLIPPGDLGIFTIIMLLFYYSIGTNLERTWGAFRYNLYIFGGLLATVIGALILYGAFYVMYGVPVGGLGSYFTTYYINLSIFMAFAASYPDMKVMLYFVIPVKIKWMAYLNVAYLAYAFITGGAATRVVIVACMLNFIVFYFGTKNLNRIAPSEIKRRHKYTKEVKQQKSATRHKCAICGRTEQDGDDLEFRYCSKCDGNYEYCQDHLFTHEHVKK